MLSGKLNAASFVRLNRYISMFEDGIRQNIFGHSVMVFYVEEPGKGNG